MVAYVFLAMLGGYGLAEIDRRRHGVGWMAGIALLFLVEATGVPIAVGENAVNRGVAMPPARVLPKRLAPPVYKFLATLPQNTVVAELPFGYTSWELRYVYYSSVHLERLVNGYSGSSPDQYEVRATALMDPLKRPDRASRALISAGVTHVLVHQSAYSGGEHAAVGEWLESRGARRIAPFRTDHLYELPR